MWWRHRGVWCDEYVCGVNSAMTAGEPDVCGGDIVVSGIDEYVCGVNSAMTAGEPDVCGGDIVVSGVMSMCVVSTRR